MDFESDFMPKSKLTAAFKSLLLSVLYVGSLYVFGSSLPRDHPVTIKQRFRRVLVVCLISLALVYSWSDFGPSTSLEKIILVLRHLGLHFDDIIKAAVLPLVLTIILFLGPLSLLVFDNDDITLEGPKSLRMSIVSSLNDIIWWRTFVVAPLTEEFVFRSCMLPVLVPAFGIYPSVFLCPLFFGLAHVHHAIEGLRCGENPTNVLIRAAFQTGYTTIFGAYSAYLFLRTGHLIGPVLCHSFCNYMGFPDFHRIPEATHPKVVATCFVLGLIAFIFLLVPLTNPTYYTSIYWTK